MRTTADSSLSVAQKKFTLSNDINKIVLNSKKTCLPMHCDSLFWDLHC